MRRYDKHYIDGAYVPIAGQRTLVIRDAVTEAPGAEVVLGSPEDAQAAVRAARHALPAWRALGAGARAACLHRIADALERNGGELAREIAREVGMPLKLSQRIQVDAPVAAWRATAALADDFGFERRIRNSLVVLEPVGVVAAITPWNYPLHQITAKLAPALLAGCTVVLKPSELAPATMRHLAQALERAELPRGVVNILIGGADVGEALVAHGGVDMLSFTGSTAVGRRIAALGAGDMKRLSMELGGKSAALVLPGADLGRAIKATLSSCFLNSGQTCSATTRLIVPRADYARCRELVRAAVAAMPMGDPLDADTRIGPLLSATQRERVRSYIAEAEQAGFELLAGGSHAPSPAAGYFVPPTVFGNVPADSRLAMEEVFGPVLAVLCHDSIEHGIALANATPYGLAAAVWAPTEEQGLAVARELRAGQIDVNGASFNPLAPFGGFGLSGVGREGGRFGLEEFLEPKSIQLS
jgi:aldehyde dehydrogenase (NAD+)/betaine-aldehyde dehydrogenase